jgi:hypothetical protein
MSDSQKLILHGSWSSAVVLRLLPSGLCGLPISIQQQSGMTKVFNLCNR